MFYIKVSVMLWRLAILFAYRLFQGDLLVPNIGRSVCLWELMHSK